MFGLVGLFSIQFLPCKRSITRSGNYYPAKTYCFAQLLVI